MAALLAFSRAQASAHSERPAWHMARTSVIAHPRIDKGVENIDDEIEEDGEDAQ